MSALLRVRDEFFGAPAQEVPPPIELALASERVSPREIIRQRVFAEVAEINEQRMAHIRGHARTRSFLIAIEDGSAEDRLNRPLRLRRKARKLDAEAEFTKALAGFAESRFIMLFDERQVDDLDSDLTVTPQSEVTFLHLSPLKGG